MPDNDDVVNVLVPLVDVESTKVMTDQLVLHVVPPSVLVLYPSMYCLIALVPATTPLHDSMTLSVVYSAGDAVTVLA
jgi:hypothetical protein